MKISPIPGLGNYGHYVDDVDFDNINDSTWIEIGKLHLKGLVTILRNVKINKDQYLARVRQFGELESTIRAHLINKYGHNFDLYYPESFADFTDDEKDFLNNKKRFQETTEAGTILTRVTGITDGAGEPTGYFSNGDVDWHSNEPSHLAFAPCVSLLGNSKMVGSSTGFVQTVDYYDSLSDNFRSELDEMVIVHRYSPGRVNEREVTDPRMAREIKMTMCPSDGVETPLVVTSPSGLRGLRYTVHTADHIKGMSKQESEKVFAEINRKLFVDRYVFDHWYQQDNDLCLFDNSVTLHRRIGGDPGRCAYRYQFYPSKLLDQPWIPYDNDRFTSDYLKLRKMIVNGKTLPIKT